eukprot:TRINITY_DN5147_c0_g1_i2.p1 TRINITY_DN5147_c0_g1~~TRINITY_DN5147_c0_g1_i2.p1  ORF type:complete len:259 (+),score=61.25 TRINITY_DN5147_c0_g1_i2:64-840(+)
MCIRDRVSTQSTWGVTEKLMRKGGFFKLIGLKPDETSWFTISKGETRMFPQDIGNIGPWTHGEDIFPRHGCLYEGRDIFYDLDLEENRPLVQRFYENVTVLGETACSCFTSFKKENSIWHLYLVPFENKEYEKTKQQAGFLLRHEKDQSTREISRVWDNGERKLVERIFMVALVCVSTRAQVGESQDPKKFVSKAPSIHSEHGMEETEEEVMMRHVDFLEMLRDFSDAISLYQTNLFAAFSAFEFIHQPLIEKASDDS